MLDGEQGVLADAITTEEQLGVTVSTSLQELDRQHESSRVRYATIASDTPGDGAAQPIGSSAMSSDKYIKLRIEEILQDQPGVVRTGKPSTAKIEKVRILFVQWYLLVYLDVLGEDFVPVSHVLGSNLWKVCIDDKQCGFKHYFYDEDVDFDILNWMVAHADDLGIRVKTRKYRDSNGELQVKYHDLPRDGVGYGTARVFRMRDD